MDNYWLILNETNRTWELHEARLQHFPNLLIQQQQQANEMEKPG